MHSISDFQLKLLIIGCLTDCPPMPGTEDVYTPDVADTVVDQLRFTPALDSLKDRAVNISIDADANAFLRVVIDLYRRLKGLTRDEVKARSDEFMDKGDYYKRSPEGAMTIADTRIEMGGTLRCCLGTVGVEFNGLKIELETKSSCPICHSTFTLKEAPENEIGVLGVWKQDSQP